jgi:hypothetical protein
VHDEDPRAEDFRAVAQLAEALTRTARQLTSDGGDTLDAERVVEFAHRCMPRTQHTGLLLRRDGEVRTVAATSDVPGRLDDLRARVGEGPALDAIETNDYVVVDDLPADQRWPDFGTRAYDELGLRSVATYRLHLGHDRAAALTFLSDWPDAFDEMGIAIGAICAAYGSLALVAEEIVGERVSHRRAVDAHREIGVAVGILLASQDLTIEEAYRRLHRAGTSLSGPLAAAEGDGGDGGEGGERR